MFNENPYHDILNEYSEIMSEIFKGCKQGTEHLVWMSRYIVVDLFFDSFRSISIDFTNKILQLLHISNGTAQYSDIQEKKDGLGELKVIGVGYGRTGTYSLSKVRKCMEFLFIWKSPKSNYSFL